jgi:RNA recognition motif-containing protein
MVKIFVGGFPPHTQELELVQLIAIYGKVCTIKIVRDKKTQKSKGYAFLEMATQEDAENAVESLNGRTMGTRELSLNIVIAPPTPPAPSHGAVNQRTAAQTEAFKKKRPRKTV